jgi:hypothetical protein
MDMIRKWRLTSHSSITTHGTLKLHTLRFGDDQIILENSENTLLRSVTNLQHSYGSAVLDFEVTKIQVLCFLGCDAV